MPKPATSSAWSGWLEATRGMSASSSPRRWRHSRSTRQWSSRETRMAIRFGRPASVSRQRMSRRSPTSCANARPSAPRSPCSSVNSIRMKNSPPSGSVECWSEEMMFAPDAARKPATAATMPWRSWQVMSSRPVTTWRSLDPPPRPAHRALQRLDVRGTALGAVALLELLARAAPARVVAAELGVLVAPALLHDRHVVRLVGLDAVALAAVGARLVLEGPARVLERAEARLLRRRGGPALGRRLVAVRRLDLDFDVVDHPGEVGPDGVHEVLEEGERLVLVGDERLDLGEPAQVDALAQVVHVVEVLAPALVDDLQQQVAFERPHELLAQFLLALLVERQGVLHQHPRELRAIDAVAVDVLGGEVDVVDLVQLGPQLVEVPVVDEVARRVLLHQAADDLLDLLARDAAHVTALEHLVAVLVDDLALLVHDVVVLEDALADEVVLLLDLALRVLDLLREHLRLDRLLFAVVGLGAEAVEDLVDPVAGEQPHEVVLGGQEEARLAGIALAAGTAAQLIVDPARLVALGADDVEAARLLDRDAVLLDALLDFGQDVVEAVLVVRVTGLEAELVELDLREVLGI